MGREVGLGSASSRFQTSKVKLKGATKGQISN